MNPPHREESKTVVPLEIGDGIGIPLDQSLESPNLYWQYVPQSGTQSTPLATPSDVAIEGENELCLATLISTMELLQGIGSEPCAVRGG
jgi:energy-converting hydrogenase Eha subunit F